MASTIPRGVAARRRQEIGLILQAAAFAAFKHRRQRRKDVEATPYINHPIALAEVLWREGRVSDPQVIAAALLHDTVEDTQTTPQELASAFGPVVAAVVAEVTDDKRLPKAERKRLQIVRARHASRRARLVKLADKICNLEDMLVAPPQDWNTARLREYFDWARKVVDQIRGTNARLERRFDALYARRP